MARHRPGDPLITRDRFILEAARDFMWEHVRRARRRSAVVPDPPPGHPTENYVDQVRRRHPGGVWYSPSVYITGSGQVLSAIHGVEQCRPHSCVIHRPSPHPMRRWPTHWREDRRIMERTCPHGVGHPDPDDLAYQERNGRAGADVHGCCGCCYGHFRHTDHSVAGGRS